MTLTLLPECRICNGTKYYREPDPAGRGQLERCPICNPEPVKQSPDIVTVRREDLLEVLWGVINSTWRSKATASFREEEVEVNKRLTAMEDAAR